MKFKGRIFKLFPMQSGTSQRGRDWQKQEFVFEFFELPTDRWSQKIKVTFTGDRINPDIQEGEEVICEFELRTNEWNGKFFNEAFGVMLVRQSAIPSPTENGQGAQAAPSDNGVTPPQASPQPPQSTQAASVGGNATPLQSVQEGDDDGVLPF